MKKTKLTRSLLAACSIVALTAVMYGCVHSGGDDTAVVTPPVVAPPVVAEPTPAEQLAEANTVVTTAQTLVDALTGSSTPEQIAAANSALASALAQLAVASAIPENEITLLRQQVADLQTKLTGLEQDIADERMASQNAQTAVTDATTALTAAQTAAAQALANLNTATSNLATAQANLAAAETGSDAQSMAVLAYQQALDAVASATTANNAEQEQVVAATGTLAAAETKLAEVDPNHAALQQARSDIAAARTAADEAAKEVADLKEKVEMLETAEADRKTAEDTAKAIEDAKPGVTAEAEALLAAIEVTDLPASLASTDIDSKKGMPTKASKLAVSDMAMADITDWAGSAYAKETAAKPASKDKDVAAITASTDAVVVYDNEAAPTPTPFGEIYNLDKNTDVNRTGNEALKIDTNNVGKVSGVAAFPSAALQTKVPFDEDDKFAGLYGGAPGTFTCDNNKCTLSTDADGKLNNAEGNWHFTPDVGSMVPVADADYMHFGYWVNKSTNLVYQASAFFGGIDASDGTTVALLEGSATYAGPATGVYVRKEFDAGGKAEHLYDGQFTADASLTAYFGGKDVAQNKQHSIDGTVTNFMDGDQAIDNTWSVTLKNTKINSTEKVDFDGTTEGDKDKDGTWKGQFFGTVAKETADTETVYPSGVAGEFNGHFVNGSVLGAFGAEQVAK